MRATLFIIVIMFALPLTAYFYSCNPCKDTKAIYYCSSIDSLSFTAFNNNDEALAENATAKWNQVHWQVGVNYQNTTCRNIGTSPFVNYAYACSPAEYETKTDSIIDIEIYCDKAIDDSHPAGTTLNDVFDMPTISEINNGSNMVCRLLKAPTEVDTYQFSVNLTLNDLSIQKVKTTPILITQ